MADKLKHARAIIAKGLTVREAAARPKWGKPRRMPPYAADNAIATSITLVAGFAESSRLALFS